jgi:hypothetical protein
MGGVAEGEEAAGAPAAGRSFTLAPSGASWREDVGPAKPSGDLRPAAPPKRASLLGRLLCSAGLPAAEEAEGRRRALA